MSGGLRKSAETFLLADVPLGKAVFESAVNSFSLLRNILACGIAAAPFLLARKVVTPSQYDKLVQPPTEHTCMRGPPGKIYQQKRVAFAVPDGGTVQRIEILSHIQLFTAVL